MAVDAPESCQGATWPLTYTAQAVEVGADPPPSTDDPVTDGGLPFTGADIAFTVAVATVLILVGFLVARVASRGRGA
jgi:hypothetical protein